MKVFKKASFHLIIGLLFFVFEETSAEEISPPELLLFAIENRDTILDRYEEGEEFIYPNEDFKLKIKKIREIPDSQWSEVFKDLESSQRIILYQDLKLASRELSARFGGDAVEPERPTMVLPLSLLTLKEEDIQFALDQLLNAETRVVWDPVPHVHKYLDSELKNSVAFLALLLETPEGRNKFHLAVKKLNKTRLSKLKQSTNTEDSRTRIEPIDLLVKASLEQALQSLNAESYGEGLPYRVNKSLLSSLLYLGLSKELQIPKTDPDENEVGILFDKISGSSVYLLCAAGKSEIISTSEETSEELTPVFSSGSFSIQKYDGPAEFLWQCGDHQYSVHDRISKPVGQLPFPPSFNLDEVWRSHQLNAVGSFALSPTTDPKTLNILKLYLKWRGYQLENEGRTYSDLSQELPEHLKKAHIFIPSTNEPEPYSFRPGWKKGLKLDFIKMVPHPKVKGESIKARLTLFVPPLVDDTASQNENSVIRLHMTDLGCLLKERRSSINDPLIVLNLYCLSSNAIGSWMNAYKESFRNSEGEFDLAGQDFEDIPFVIGSRDGFSGENILDIARTLSYPLNLMDDVLQAKNREEIIEGLKNPPEDQALQSLFTFISYFSQELKQQLEEVENNPRGYYPETSCDSDAHYQVGNEHEILLKKLESQHK